MTKTKAYSTAIPGCPIEKTLGIIGGKYKGMILYHLLNGSLRNSDFLRIMPDITQRVLTLQLRELEKAGLVNRKVFPVVPPKVEYSLTSTGESLQAILRSMQDWGITYLKSHTHS